MDGSITLTRGQRNALLDLYRTETTPHVRPPSTRPRPRGWSRSSRPSEGT